MIDFCREIVIELFFKGNIGEAEECVLQRKLRLNAFFCANCSCWSSNSSTEIVEEKQFHCNRKKIAISTWQNKTAISTWQKKSDFYITVTKRNCSVAKRADHHSHTKRNVIYMNAATISCTTTIRDKVFSIRNELDWWFWTLHWHNKGLYRNKAKKRGRKIDFMDLHDIISSRMTLGDESVIAC